MSVITPIIISIIISRSAAGAQRRTRGRERAQAPRQSRACFLSFLFFSFALFLCFSFLFFPFFSFPFFPFLSFLVFFFFYYFSFSFLLFLFFSFSFLFINVLYVCFFWLMIFENVLQVWPWIPLPTGHVRERYVPFLCQTPFSSLTHQTHTRPYLTLVCSVLSCFVDFLRFSMILYDFL